jgi:hypothetical protein
LGHGLGLTPDGGSGRTAVGKAELRVFVASPGGLDDERLAVEEIANVLNSNQGDRLNVVVTVQRFEQRAARAGRPQGQINEWVDRCEVLIAILHRKLGSLSGEGSHTGFSEEFDRAIGRFNKTGRPVVSLHFKSVDPAEEEDPGPKLQEVLDFRERIEREHVALYQRFESLEGFKLLVYQLLSEEMLELSSQAKSSDEESAPSATPESERSVRGDAEPLDAESGIVEVLDAFSDVIRDGSSERELDLDRLMMFATGVAHDAEAPGVHLTNRVYLRRKPEAISLWEAEAWFRAYVADHGRSSDASERAVPFALSVGREGIVDRLLDRRLRFLDSEVGHLQRGYLRLLSAYRLRPEVLWPTDGSSAPWEHVADSSPRFEIVDYWATVATADDKAIAQALAASEKAATAELGLALLSLADDDGTLDPLVSLDPKLLLSTRVADRCGGAPIVRVSTDVLLALLKRTYLDDKVKALAASEIAHREAWTAELVDDLLDDGLIGRYFNDSWKHDARDLLFRTTSPDAIVLLAKVIAGKKNTESPLLLAEFAGANPLFREAYMPTAPDYLAAGALQEHFALHASNPKFRRHARQALAGTFEPTKKLVEELRIKGSSEDVIEFVEQRDLVSALTYLAFTPQGLTKPEMERLREMVANANRFRYDLLLVLEEVANDNDVPTLLERAAFRWRDGGGLLSKILRRATLTRLRSLLDGDQNDVVIGALKELERRERLPAQAKLREMLRHANADIRMLALRLLIPQLSNVAEFIAVYVAAGPNYYYNVVCELDRIASGSPDAYG